MQPLERLVNLVALLLESRRPLTFDEIREKLGEAYEHGDVNSAKRMFERDKDVLRDIGVPIEVSATDVWDAEQGYTIAKERYYLPEIRFTVEEITALAVAARSGADTAAEDAVRKLLSGATEGILATLPSDVGPVTETATETLTAAAEAVAGSRRVRFAYRTASGASAERTVDAYGLAVRGGHWYLVGLDRDRDEIRSFRLSRVASSLTEDGQAEPPPEGFRASDHVRTAPWGPGEGEGSATVAFAPDVAWWATTGIAGVEDLETRADGWSVVRLPATPGESLAAWVLSFGPAAEALEPPELRDEVVRRLGSAVGA
jgi:proteasome accessory factor B